MKVLLFGDYSALHKHLKDGLQELGHSVTLLSNGDSFKKISNDINLSSNKKGLLRKVEILLKQTFYGITLSDYDVVQFISPMPFLGGSKLAKLMFDIIRHQNEKVFIVGAGGSSVNTIIADYYQNEFKYPQMYQTQVSEGQFQLWSQSEIGREYNRKIFDKIDGYIPIMYEYAQGYRQLAHKKLKRTIQIPFNMQDVEYFDNKVESKIILFHGINRPKMKGGDIIMDAMRKVEAKYPQSVKSMMIGGVAYNEYLKCLNNANIVLDQTYSVSYGVNAVINMAMGKVVLGGGEKEFLNEFSLSHCPILPIEPDIDSISNKIEEVLDNKSKIKDIGWNSHCFAKEFHNHITVAKLYEEVWCNK